MAKKETDPFIAEANEALPSMSAEERIRWSVERFGDGAVMLSSMQKTASVLMHMFHVAGFKNDILFGDTGYHFRETLQLRDDFVRKYDLNIVTLYPELTPEQQEEKYDQKLYQFFDGQPVCCRLRKEEPFVEYAKEHDRKLVMIGLMREEGGRRAEIGPLRKDPRIDGYALHPLFDWDLSKVKDYVEKHDVPVHPLHAQSYPSIGCQVCTTPVQPGESPRAGRWRHLREPGKDGPLYCGINFGDGGGI